MGVTKTIEEARANLEASIPSIEGRYKASVERADWATPAGSDSAESNFAGAMQNVIAKKLRQSGVKRVGNQFWQQRASTLGASRIGAGLREGLDKYAENFGKTYVKIQAAVKALPPRGLDPMSNIDNRLKPVVRAAIDGAVHGR